jgi:hypothetical protein
MLSMLIPLLDWIVLGLVIHSRSQARLTTRESLLVSATATSAWLILGTELLGGFRAIAFWPVFLWWAIPLPCLVLLFLKSSRARLWSLFSWPRRLRYFDWALLTIIVAILSWAWCQAVFSPPNNIDSQEYHLQRQVFWLQQKSVEHYPTSSLRQVVMPPLTEFAGLTQMVLTGGDRYHNLVQWLALILSACAVSLIVRRFNRSPTAQLLAALWVVTIPLAFLQASTTKNDVVVMLWVCLLAYWVLLLDTSSRLRWTHVILIGVGFGSLVLTKGTGLIFGLPVGAYAAFLLLRRQPRKAIPALILIGTISLAFNAGHFTRNHHAFQSIAPDRPGVHDGPPLSSTDHSLGAVTSTMLRMIGPHLALPNKVFNERLTQFMRDAHEKLGRNIDDPRTTWVPGGRFRPYEFSQTDEDKAAAPAHLYLALLLPVVLLWARRDASWRAIVPLLVIVVTGFVLFCLLLKWQNWHVRLIIVLPALIAPVFGGCLAARRMRYVAPLAAAILVLGLVPSLNSWQRPLLGPKNIFQADPLALRCYFRPQWAGEYRELAGYLDQYEPRVVGFFTGSSSPDYPMQRLLLDRYEKKPVFTAFNARFSIAEKPEPAPDVLLVARSNAKRLQHAATGLWYAADKRFGRYTVFLKQPGS